MGVPRFNVLHYSLITALIYGYAGGIGVTAGTHRLWTHRSYKANTPLQVLLMLMQTSSLQVRWSYLHTHMQMYVAYSVVTLTMSPQLN